MSIASLVFWVATALVASGIAYQLFAIRTFRRFVRRARPFADGAEPVTLMKPLHGLEPRLAENLTSFCEQDYAGPVQMVCGLASADDPAAEIVRALQRQYPGRIDLVIDPARHGSNAKVGNLINMLPAARHNILVFSDADITARRDYLRVVVGGLDMPGVGALTCLFYGRGDAGCWSVLSAATLSYGFLTHMVTSRVTRLAVPCAGPTIALRRETLAAAGGLERLANVLADDYVLGEAVRALGLRVHVSPMMVEHGCAEASLAETWRHHLRWAVTVRDLARPGHWASVASFPLVFAAVALAVRPEAGALLLLAALGSRFGLKAVIDRCTGRVSAPWWLVPFADLFYFMVFLASLVARKVEWRGQRFTVEAEGRIAEAESLSRT